MKRILTDNQIVEGPMIINKNVVENHLTVTAQDDMETDDESDDDHDHERLTNTHTNTQTYSHDHFHSPSGNHLQQDHQINIIKDKVQCNQKF